MLTATKAAQNGAAATDATAAQVTETVAAASRRRARLPTRSSPIPPWPSSCGQSARFFDGFAATVKKAAGLTVDAYHQAGGLYLGDPTAWV